MEKKYDTETFSKDGVSNKEHFLRENHAENAAKASPRSLYNFGK